MLQVISTKGAVMSSFHRTACLLLLACLVVFAIALQAQEFDRQAPKQPPSSAQKPTADQSEGLPADLPTWAYGFDNATEGPRADSPESDARGGPDNGALRHVPGSPLSFTLTQIRDNSGPADWFPNDHPAMPDIVAHGHKPDVVACSFCHYPNGKGRPVNTNLAGLPYSYILYTLSDFKNHSRGSSDTRKSNTNQMIKFATLMTDDEKKDAARYFSSMKWTPWTRVVEADMVPKTYIANGIYLRLPGDEVEPIRNRIIETPENVEQMEVLRNDRSGFVAYVPTGSIKKGAALVLTGGNGKTTRCTICHGADLMGLGPVPLLAGRSPSYLVRQMYDMRNGKRSGEWASLMIPVVANLTTDDMMAIAAYLASRDVSSGSATASN
jgi:cytochrome c553